jgi:hypothetical protein
VVKGLSDRLRGNNRRVMTFMGHGDAVIRQPRPTAMIGDNRGRVLGTAALPEVHGESRSVNEQAESAPYLTTRMELLAQRAVSSTSPPVSR